MSDMRPNWKKDDADNDEKKPKAEDRLGAPDWMKQEKRRGKEEDVITGSTPEEAAQKAAAEPSGVTEHTVVEGESLSTISEKYFGSSDKWKAIYDENRDVIGKDPNLIRVGQVLQIPALDR